MHAHTHFHVLEIEKVIAFVRLTYRMKVVGLINGFCATSFKILVVSILKGKSMT